MSRLETKDQSFTVICHSETTAERRKTWMIWLARGWNVAILQTILQTELANLNWRNRVIGDRWYVISDHWSLISAIHSISGDALCKLSGTDCRNESSLFECNAMIAVNEWILLNSSEITVKPIHSIPLRIYRQYWETHREHIQHIRVRIKHVVPLLTVGMSATDAEYFDNYGH